MSESALWIITVVAFVLGAFYSGSETALIAANQIRLRHLAAGGERRAERVLALVAHPEYFLSAVLVGTNLAVIGGTTALTVIATRHYGDAGATIATVVLVPLFLVFNEIIPKALFLLYATRAAVLTVDILRGLTALLYPIVKLFTVATDTLSRLLPARAEAGTRMGTDELLFHIEESREAGLIPRDTKVLVDRAIALQELRACDVMRPLSEVAMLDRAGSAASWAEAFARSGFSRLPVYEGARENVVGMLSAHRYVTARGREDTRDRLLPPYLVSLDEPVVNVFQEMSARGRHMAMIRDERGVIVGMTTLEDILERFVGAIVDEFN
ncbi:MAG: hemolysin family protein [Candidatus Krumholzibacteria bacterium]|nr:hemolysin family protein [Candidatus Krumholzibacteria bacterium]